jgi:inorganic pyrophosphatase
VAVLETPYNPPPFHSLEELSSQCLDEVEHFFISYNQMEGRQFRPLGRHGPEKAKAVIERAMIDCASRHRSAGKSRISSNK